MPVTVNVMRERTSHHTQEYFSVAFAGVSPKSKHCLLFYEAFSHFRWTRTLRFVVILLCIINIGTQRQTGGKSLALLSRGVAAASGSSERDKLVGEQL